MAKGILKQNNVHLQEHVFATVRLLLEKGYDVELIPPIQAKGVSNTDIYINAIPWELKAPQGDGKNTIRHTMQNAGHQSSSAIVDLRRCKLSQEQAIKELKYYFKLSKRLKRLMVVTRDNELLDISK